MNPKHFIAYWFPVLLYAWLIFVLSSRELAGGGISTYSTFLHMIEFFFLAFLLFRAFNNSQLREYSYPLAIILAAVYGFIDEIHQAFVPGRVSDLKDALADTLGASFILFGALIPKNLKMKSLLNSFFRRQRG